MLDKLHPEDREGSEIPIIFLTGQGDIATCARAMKSGASEFLTKPVDDEELVQAVHLALEKDLQGQQTRAERADALQRLATLTPREHEVLLHVIAGRLRPPSLTGEPSWRVRSQPDQPLEFQGSAFRDRESSLAKISVPCLSGAFTFSQHGLPGVSHPFSQGQIR